LVKKLKKARNPIFAKNRISLTPENKFKPSQKSDFFNALKNIK